MAQAEMAFCMGVAAGVAGVVAVIASVAVAGMKVAVFYNTHKQQVDAAVRHMDVALRTLQWLRQNCPVTHRQIGALVPGALWQALVSVPEGITAADVAAVVGRMFGGLANAPEAGLGTLLRVLAGGASTAAGRLPAMAVRGGVGRAGAAADQFLQQLRSNGSTLSPADMEAIRREFQRHPEVEQKLRELHQSLRESAPVLQALAQAFRIEAMPEIQGQSATGAAQ